MGIYIVVLWASPWNVVGGYQSFETSTVSTFRVKIKTEQIEVHDEAIYNCTVITVLNR
jgi:hypothetical protein